MSYKLFADKLYSLSPQSRDSSYKDVLEQASRFFKKRPLIIDDTKWPPISLDDIKSKFIRWQKVLKPQHTIALRRVAKYLYLIERA